jgi:ABC-2 type transport system ATP-binding protein
MLTGILAPDAGCGRIMGHPVGSLRAKQVSGVVPEQANAYMDLSAGHNLMLMGELTAFRKRSEAAGRCPPEANGVI